MKASIDSVRKGGVVTLIGNIAPTVEFPLQSVVTREVSVLGSCASANDYPACLEMMARGAIQVEPMISETAPLERGAEMFDRLYNHDACDPDGMIVLGKTAHGEVVETSRKEFELLRLLVNNRGRVLARDQILNRVWGYDYYGTPRTIDNFIQKLREKVEDDAGSPRFFTIRWR